MKTVLGDKKIDERTFEFALKIVQAYKFLVGRKEYVLSKQLLRAGTSIGANVQEAQAAQSRKDFASKMSIASKEARETLYWLRLLAKSGFFRDYASLDDMYTEVNWIRFLQKSGYLNEYSKLELLDSEICSIIKIITSIVKTTQNPKPKTNLACGHTYLPAEGQF
jgi:four helix bundle protein